MNKGIKKAFTMAEILITLTIIGTISVLVLPSVTNNTSGKQFLVTYKKTYSVLNQTVDSHLAMTGWDFAGTRENYQDAVGTIFTTKMGAALDNSSKWTITGLEGSGFTLACAKAGHATEDQVCFASDYAPEFEVNGGIAASNPGTHVYAMRDGLASIIILGDSYDTPAHVPCRAVGQRTVNPPAGTTDATLATLPYSSAANYCLGYIDVNGAKGPNTIVSCVNGMKNEGKIKAEIPLDGCEVSPGSITDVYPIIIYGDTVAPASAAGLAIFQDRFAN